MGSRHAATAGWGEQDRQYRVVLYSVQQSKAYADAGGMARGGEVEQSKVGGGMRPKTYVYIAGPYGDRDPYCTIDARINEARNAARELAIRGVPYYSPHLNCAHFEVIAPEASVEFWTAMGMGFVENAWGMWMLPGWLDSKGSKAERWEAEQLGIAIWYPLQTADDIAAAWHGQQAHRYGDARAVDA